MQNRGKFTSDKIEIDTQGFGGLVGALRGGFIKFSTGDAGFKPNLKVRSANVGGIVGCYSGGLIGIENSNNNYYVTLSGYYNVGGAIGYFAAGSLNNLLLGDKNSRWNFLNNSSAFAEINSFDKADLSADNYFANWGGLIGYFNSFENLSIAPDVSDGEKSDGIVNNNNIYIGTMEHDTSSNKTVSANPVLENVGGVIGKVSADEQINISYLTNNGEINEVKQQGNNDIGNVYHKFEQDEEIYLVKFSAKSKTQNDNYIFALLATNVGGVVGKLENATISNLSAKGSTVFGYKNVGGLIGYAYNVYTSENISVGANAVVVGVINVGGAIGEVSYDKNVEIKSGNGICNVNVEKGAKIYGNYNVGGLVGFLVNGTIENCTVGAEVKTNGNQSGQEVQADTQEPSQDANQNVTIKGIYFAIINFATSEYSGFTEADGTNINKEACFFPTNVGGLIGSTQAGQNVETKLFIIANNKLNNIIISSSLEGQVAIAESSEQTSTSVPVYNESTVISTISNAVLNENVTNNLSTLVQNRTDKGKFKSTIVSTYLQDFETAKTGFGGFIGSTEASAMLTTANQNVMSNVKIDASLGINVGSFYGYYNANKSYDVNNSLRTIITPKLNGDVSVTGAYFVGGIAGSIKAEDETISFNSNTKAGDISTDNSTPPTIYIQTGEYNIGMYVGGLFGNLNGKANGLKIDNSNGNSIQFRINNINSFYTGGLIGRLEGVLGDKDTSIDTNIVNAIYKQKVGDNSVETNKGGAFALIDYTESKTDSDANGNATKEPIDIKSSQATENFGGLVGMLKKPKISNIPDIDPSTAYVIGWHPYAFTVNTIENENYQDGKTNYDYEDGIEDSVYLTAQAYYVNQDNFEISYSRGGAEVGDDVEYSYTYDGIYDNVNSTSIWFNQNSNSPLNENCFGWAKDYTMFKIMQRRIPQGTNGNTAEWDSIATVYDASRISTVLTLTNAFTCDAKDSRKIPYSYKKVIDPENPENPPKYEMATSLFENYDKNGNGNIGNLVEILDKNEKDEDKKELADFANHIFYTIYETSDFESGSELSEPILYSRMGIARMLRDENNKPAENPKGRAVYYYNGDLKNDNYNDNIKNDSKSLTSWGGVVYYEIDDNFEDTSLTSFDFSSNLFDIFIDQNFEEWNIKDSSLNKLYFLNFASEDNAFESITEYWPPPGEDEPYLKYPVTIDFEDRIPMDTLCNIRNSKNKYDVQDNTGAVNQTLEFELNTEFIYLVNLNRGDEVLNNKKWFKFETIFQNPTSSSLTNVDSPDYSSKDGNILNVNGFVSSALYNELNKESSKTFHIENNTGLLTGVFIVLGGLIGLLGLLAGPWWIAVIGVAAGIIAGGITGHFVGIGEYNRLVNKYKNKVIANDIIMDKTFTRNGLSYGLFGETFNRELYYEYDEATESYVLKAQPETYKTINGEQYVYYSSTRPRTFYDEYYILRNIDENKEPIKVPKSEVTPDGNGVYTYKGTKYSGIADKDGYVMTKNFEYRNGVYYINLYGTAIENIPYQYPFNSNGYNESHYVDANGTIYAQGKATLNEDGSISYTLPKVEQKVDGSIGSKNKLYLEGNLIKNISSNENYKGITETEFMQKFSGITFRYKRRMYYKKIDESEISSHSDNFIVRAGQTPGLEENRYYFGYGYMKNAYYTALSNVKTDDKKQGYFVLVGFTDNVGTYNGEKCYGEFGIDYLQKQITITSQHSDGTSDKYNITAYYQFVGTSNETIQDSLTEYNEIDKANVTYQPIINEEHYSSSPLTIECKDINNKHFSIKDILLRKANCLQVGLYPHSFENPYTNTNEAIPYEYLTSESNNLTQKEANVNLSLEGTQDENYYIAISIESENIPNEDLNNYVIKNDVEYFYYEGDYVAYSTNYLSESFTNKYDYEYSGNLKLDDNGNGVVFKHYANISNIKLSKEGEDSKQHQYNETNHGHEIDDGWQVESFIYSSQFSDESDSVTKIKQLDNNNDFLKKYKVDIVENYTKEKIESKLSIDLATLALKFADYKSWYVYDESIDPEKINVDLFKVSNMFYVKYGGRATTDYYELYMRDDDVSVNSGILSKSWADTGGGDDDYNRNKFLMNKEYQIYTRYKFEDNIPVNALQGYSGKIFQNGCWSVIDNATPQYYLYLKGSSYPNKEKTNTYFVESLLVTLGGNVDVTCDVNNITTHSGSFTAK